MNRYSILLLMLAAIFPNAFPLSAHDNERMFPISYLSDVTLAALDQDDASVDDWVEAVGEPTLTPLDFDLRSSYTQVTSYDPSNLDFRIWLGWSRDGKIHFAGQFADDAYYNEYDPDYYLSFSFYDSISLMVDGDHSGGEYDFPSRHEELEGPLETNMQAQWYEAISRAAGDPLVDLPGTTGEVEERWMVEPPFSRGGGSVLGEKPTFWHIEFYVTCFDRLSHLSPEDSDVSQLTEGRIIGFDIWVVDFDDDSGLNALYHMDRPDGAEPEWPEWFDASNFVDGLLLGPGGVPGDSAVQSVSWGRIKASLE